MSGAIRDSFDVMLAIEDLLKSDIALEGVDVCIQEFPNSNPKWADKGWIGIYDNEVNYDPSTLGGDDAAGNPIQWQFSAEFFILVQYASFASGRDCSEHLHDLEKAIIKRLFLSKKIKDTVDQITEVSVSYSTVPRFDEEDEGTEKYNFQQALIEINVEVDRR